MIEYNLDTEHSILHVQRKSATSVMRRNLETLGSRLYRDRGPRHACASHCLVGDRQQHAERVDAAAIHSPETVLIGCLAGPCGFGSLDCELIRDFSRCGRLVLCPMFFVSASSSSRVLSRMCRSRR
jgi:hypothetical protein